MGDYSDFHRRSIADRDGFWREQSSLIDWQSPPQQICDYSNPPFAKWFVGGTTNLCHNAVDRHLKTRADQAALIFVSTEVDKEVVYTFSQLQAEVERMAAILLSLGWYTYGELKRQNASPTDSAQWSIFQTSLEFNRLNNAYQLNLAIKKASGQGGGGHDHSGHNHAH